MVSTQPRCDSRQRPIEDRSATESARTCGENLVYSFKVPLVHSPAALSGSIAVTFSQTSTRMQPGNLLAHAHVMTDDDKSHWFPVAEDGSATEFLVLPITPVRVE